MKRRSLLSYIAVFFLCLTLAVSCGNPASQMSTGSSSAVRLGYSAWPGWFPWQVSQEQKIFADHDVEVTLQWFDGYLESINTLTAGQLDANSQTLNDTISAVAGGADEVVVLVNDNSTGNDKIIVRNGINAIADLKGKKVAAEEGTVDHFLLLLGLQQEGLTQEDIEFIPLEQAKLTIFMITHDVEEAVFLSNRIYALSARPGTVKKEMTINLPERTPTIKRQSIFHDYRDELMDLLRRQGQDALAAVAA